MFQTSRKSPKQLPFGARKKLGYETFERYTYVESVRTHLATFTLDYSKLVVLVHIIVGRSETKVRH